MATGGGGSKDIQALSAAFDAGSGAITVAMTLCAPPDDQTKYRVHFDHTQPFAPDADRNGDTLITADDFCVTTSDTGMMHKGNKDTGPGQIAIAGAVLTYTVNMAELNPALAIGDSVLVWADIQNKGIKDRAPDTDAGNGCDEPEVAGEFITLLLSDAIIYAVGGDGPAGGKVFRITDGGLHGLEAAPVDQSAAAPWGCIGTIMGADGAAIGTGAQNTADILAGCNEAGIAARIADDYELNGYTDWFLPSKDELNLMYDNIGPGAAFPFTNVGGFVDNVLNSFYWSSMEWNADSGWGRRFSNGNQGFIGKGIAQRVRAVHAF